MPYTVAEIAHHLGGQVVGDGSIPLGGFAPADTARPGDLTFAENEAYFARAERSAASAILVAGEWASATKVLIRVPNARIAFAKVLPLFHPEPVFAPGIHATALVAPTAEVDGSAHVGPYCVVGEGARIGARTVLEAMVHVGTEVHIGEDARFYPRVTVYPSSRIGNRVVVHAGAVIGSDGYGYVTDGGVHRKIPQVGNVVINDDVEIGANVTIDRGALGSTVIGKGTKIDNLVQIGHNVVVGEHCLVVAQVGIAGSTRLGSYVTLAGQAGLAGHLKIGNQVLVAAQSGVMHDIPDKGRWMGSPARPDWQMKRQLIALDRLPDLLKRIADLERRLETIGRTLNTEAGPERKPPPGSTP
ncbi:MAG TPA: UDP-3-O-(3-hydroxymyristoyl)glucosamine N-acyltransferase [Candidatus Paceibacterota bacterium]|nr:UDP-3-O-(3-hydroxymyristoyl)glucosamine N-acyltransferase [Candidatus Paceibacterota bacterium]HRZ56859.1 UDP-3-O-(3-hydroxymyristoyl)glucosamine N-acyltransferase [Candidatus Paceibacterota bacterium]